MRRALGGLAIAVALVATTSSCSIRAHTAPEPEVEAVAGEPAIAMRFPTPAVYYTWYAEVEACSGLHRDTLPSFWVANVVMFTGAHRGDLAFYDVDRNRVVLGLGYETVSWVVKHEVLHHLLQPILPATSLPGESHDAYQRRQHPAEYFAREGKCGAHVNIPIELRERSS